MYHFVADVKLRQMPVFRPPLVVIYIHFYKLFFVKTDKHVLCFGYMVGFVFASAHRHYKIHMLPRLKRKIHHRHAVMVGVCACNLCAYKCCSHCYTHNKTHALIAAVRFTCRPYTGAFYAAAGRIARIVRLCPKLYAKVCNI